MSVDLEQNKVKAAYTARFFCIGASLAHVLLIGLLLSRGDWWLAVILAWPACMAAASWRHLHIWIKHNEQ